MAIFSYFWSTLSPFRKQPVSDSQNRRRHTLEPLSQTSRKRRNSNEAELEVVTTSKKRKLAGKTRQEDTPLATKINRSITPSKIFKKLALKSESPDTPDPSSLKDETNSQSPSDVLESVEYEETSAPMALDDQSDSSGNEDDADDVEDSEDSENSSVEDDYEADSDESSNENPQHNQSSSAANEEDETVNESSILDESAIDAKDTKIKVATGLYITPSLNVMEQERARRKRNAEKLVGWSQADKALSYKIAMRGLEPLIPANWHCEFPVFMSELFARHGQEAFIDVTGRHGHLSDNFWAMRYLTKLMELGPRVRDKFRANLPPEKIMKRQFEDYIWWSLRDANVVRKKGRLPMIEIVAGPKETDTSILQNKLARQLIDLANKWRDALANPNDPIPPLYGIIATYGVVGIASFVPEGTGRYSKNDPSNRLRSIGIFDYKDGKHDVWNGFAIAILAIHSRNILLNLLDNGKVSGYDGTDEVIEEYDPDL